jgi:hypothetical protein
MLLPKQIVALGKIVARAAGRLGLSAVRIERHERGPRAMATDGRRAVIFQWDEPEADKYPAVEGMSTAAVRKFAANVPPKALADAGRAIAGRTPNPLLKHLLLDESDASMVKVAATANNGITRAQAKAVDGDFPDCGSVLPAPSRQGKLYNPASHGVAAFTHTRIGVNARQFAETMRVVSDLAADDTNNTVVMTVPVDPSRPIRLDARCPGRRAAAAIMPVSADLPSYDDEAKPQRPAGASRQRVALPPAPPSTPAPASSRARTPKRPRKPRTESAGMDDGSVRHPG